MSEDLTPEVLDVWERESCDSPRFQTLIAKVREQEEEITRACQGQFIAEADCSRARRERDEARRELAEVKGPLEWMDTQVDAGRAYWTLKCDRADSVWMRCDHTDGNLLNALRQLKEKSDG